ncbi:hypothetical protein H9Q72_014020 [Fusarium xylarioides]|uniref:Flavin-containing monooxygenase n=1 Tax=Fusarium xylarioides TaxID=221167 RepID=A0A9P7HKI8_9HYPO|nr:hypothetical protein H9Q72_014020 [Fusarium xylarioides]
MAPPAVSHHTNNYVDANDTEVKAAVEHPVSVRVAECPPVSDDYMYDFKYNHRLPTTDVLGIEVPQDCDARAEAERIVHILADALGSGNAEVFANFFLEYGVWRDKLSFTWDQRTFNFRPAILRAAQDLLPSTRATNFTLLNPPPEIERFYDDYAHLKFVVSFDTELVIASAVIKAVLTKDEGWKIYTMHTVAEQLRQFPERAPDDGHMTGMVSWETQRKLAIEAADPEILIIGGGQNGLALAARCKVLNLNCLIVEKDEVGDVWKKRYDYLSLHFPHWADDLPYFRYPKHWPTYTPAQKQGAYMEWYVSAMELNIWTKSTVIEAKQNQGHWAVKVNKCGEDIRTLRPKHVVMATSLCGLPYIPEISGMGSFDGVIRHSSVHDNCQDFVGKKVLVVGTSSSGFDTALDCSRRGIDVTLLQRSPTYVMSLTHSVPRMYSRYAPDTGGNRVDPEEVDRIFFSTPVGPGEEFSRRMAKTLEDLDRPMLDALNARGLRTWRGQRQTGNSTLGQTRNGGFYFDAGACQHIIDGKIKIEPGSIERFEGGKKVIFSGGREREFDLVIFATGYSNLVDAIQKILGPDVSEQIGPVWGIDEEGEYINAFKETGVPNFWIMVGALPVTRYQSKVLALRLKALQEGISPPPV